MSNPGGLETFYKTPEDEDFPTIIAYIEEMTKFSDQPTGLVSWSITSATQGGLVGFCQTKSRKRIGHKQMMWVTTEVARDFAQKLLEIANSADNGDTVRDDLAKHFPMQSGGFVVSQE